MKIPATAVALGLLAATAAASAQESSSFPFIAIRSVMSMHASAGGELSCSTSVNGQLQPEGPCGPENAARELRALHRDAETTMVMLIRPDEIEAPGDPPGVGELLLEAKALLGIAPNGRIVRCRQSVRRVVRHAAGVRAAPDLCREYSVGRQMFVATTRTEARNVDVSVTVFLRVDGAEPVHS
jgi:hypothetical protein